MGEKFDISVFNNKLSTQWLGHSICYFNELESTNTYVKKLPKEEVHQGMICLTDNQLKGRGQYERRWESETGKNLTFSLVFRPQSPRGFHVLTLACALALVEQLCSLVGESSCAYIKWPNDVILKRKKVAGLLTETVFNGNHLDRLIFGMGLNVNQASFSPDLVDKATSIHLETGKVISREHFLCELLGRIEHKYSLWHRRQDGLLKSINRSINGYGKWIGLKVNDKLRDDSYKMLGVDESGKLLMLNQDGGIESFSYEQIRLVTD
ncbi:MAG TPA: biotin--[acetyl-CoA-carboxylase] ligase [Balneolaceae bacterium]